MEKFDLDRFAAITGLVMLAVAAVIVVVRIAYNWRRNEHSEKCRVSRRLKRFAAPRGFRVLDDVKLEANGQTGWADHILIGYFGVLLVYDIIFAGDYYGKPGDKYWSLGVPGQGRYRMENPLLQADRCAGRVLYLLHEAGIKLPSPEHAVVITAAKRGVTSYIKSEDVVQFSELGKLLGRTKFQQDRDVDVEKVAEVLAAAQASPEKFQAGRDRKADG